jgi:hypothetical protein
MENKELNENYFKGRGAQVKTKNRFLTQLAVFKS